jgi:hypothetical protein
MNRKSVWTALAISAVLISSAGCKNSSVAATSSAAEPATPESLDPPKVTIDGVVIGKLKVNPDFDQYLTTVTNAGPTSAKIDGACTAICPPEAHMTNSSLSAAKGAVVAPGTTKTLSADQVATICSNILSGATLQCTYTVQGLDTHGKPVGTQQSLSWSGAAKLQ